MKIVHLPTTVGGNPQGISRHLNKIGFQSETWTVKQNYIAYPADKILTKPDDGRFIIEIKKLLALRYIFLFDVVFFNFGGGLFRPASNAFREHRSYLKKTLSFLYYLYSSLMQRLELLLLKHRGIPVLIQYQGSDARQNDFCAENFDITHISNLGYDYNENNSDENKRAQIKLFNRYCHKIYALNPDLLHVLPDRAEFLPYSHIDLSDWSPVYNQAENRPLRIGHAPSHRGIKGTEFVISAVENLRKTGMNFEFILIEGLSNTEAKKVYQTIDVLIDQLLVGWYGGLAVEAMALGKPVLAYIREDDLQFIPDRMKEDLPIINVEANILEETLRHVIGMPRNEIVQLGMKSRLYVEKWHDPTSIANRIKHDIEQIQIKN